jgi:L-alanine-DL-glutamate epimerase-like enolase superfamily enzyme
MKITDIELIAPKGPRLPVVANPAFKPGTPMVRYSGGVIVKVTTDEGITGVGAVDPQTGSAGAIVEDWIKPQLIGKDPFAVEQHAGVLRMANSCYGIEIALWDIIGKACGQPVYKLWGGYQDKVPAYASFIEVRTPERRAEDVRRAREHDWRAVKLRTRAWTMTEDVAQVAAVRRAIGEGDDVLIMCDANQAEQPGNPHHAPGPVWSEKRALQTAREFDRLGVYWLEEPLSRDNFDGLARLAAAVDTYIAGGENNVGLHDLQWMIERDCVDVIQPEALVTDGISQIRKICGLAELHHKLVAPHVGNGGIGMLAHLHLCAAIPNASHLEVFHDPPNLTSDLFQWYLAEPLRIDADGYMHVPQKPGFGIELDEDKIRFYQDGDKVWSGA